MGVKNCPETPRQKMINMMYIVLTAMLALNVAAEVLEAFRLVDASLLHTMEGVETKNQQVYAAFDQAYIENPVKVQEWKDKADYVRKISADMVSYISSLKKELVNYSGSEQVNKDNPYDPDRFNLIQDGDTLEIKKEDDLNGTSEFMITQKRANELKQQIITYKNNLVSNINEDDTELRNTILTTLETPDPSAGLKSSDEQKTWESQYFENKPLIAVLTLLSKMQIDVTNSEATVINYLYAQIDAGSFKFNSLGAKVIAKSNLVIQGEPYEAEVFLAAEDTTQQPQIIINGKEAEIKDGKAIYKVNTNEAGTFKWSGLIKYKTPAGIIQNYPFEQEYQVTTPSVTMSATKMNVFYKGLKNPFDVNGGGGIAREDLDPQMTNGKITKSGNAWVVEPTDLDEVGNGKTKISVYANIGGTRRLIGTSNWRVKRVPDPVAKVGDNGGGDIRKESLAAQDGVRAVLEDFDFDFKYTVTEFEMQATQGGYVVIRPSKSNRFTTEQMDLINRANPQSLIYIGNIKARGDDGSIRDLKPITFVIR